MRAYSYKSNTQTNYNGSERLAIRFGFEVILDDNAYNGRYFIKDGKKWIHNIAALKSQLGVSNDSQLKSRGYDVDTYYRSHRA